MKTRQIVALIAGGCVALISLIPLIGVKGSTFAPINAFVWWIAVFGVAVAAVIIVAAFWKE